MPQQDPQRGQHRGRAEDRPQEELFDPVAATRAGPRRAAARSQWSSDTETGDRDELAPGVPDRSWSQVSVSARECIGVSRCPFGTDCFAEKARDKAGHADVVVTNHALLAIDAIDRRSRCCPNTTCSSSTRRTNWSTGSPGVATGELSATIHGRRAAPRRPPRRR